MRQFFLGWKRKLGSVTLVLACLMTCGWIRSAALDDQITFQSGNRVSHYLYSSGGWLGTTSIDDFPDRPFRPVRWSTSIHRINAAKSLFDWPVAFRDAATRLDLQIAYWLVTMPLIVLSAWLLMSNPRVKIEPRAVPASEDA